jgi:putative component of membrane protein insertase Oxa1/YidC/SpoIIIJ protein YidD|tara:strand:+ start:152 stop:823 length:672 start_codon:yes stop_codon:yes gene_type:complete
MYKIITEKAIVKIITYCIAIISIGYSNKMIDGPLYFTYPADTILSKENLYPLQHFSISMIKIWQTFSYNNPDLNCQFYPSCSNFCAINIYKKGTISGLIIGADRFVRCNNSAYRKYQIYSNEYILPEDYRLSDNLIPQENINTMSKNVFIGITLSIVPGLGRVYYGQFTDGINSFKYTTPFLISSYYSHKNNNDIFSILFGSIGLLFWASDFYGVYNLSHIYH